MSELVKWTSRGAGKDGGGVAKTLYEIEEK